MRFKQRTLTALICGLLYCSFALSIATAAEPATPEQTTPEQTTPEQTTPGPTLSVPATPAMQAQNALAQLKAGHPDESARIIREMLIRMQLELIMDPNYAKNSAELYARSPQMLKQFFEKEIENQNATAGGTSTDTKAIIESLINNTVPKDYTAQLKKHCDGVDAALKQLDEFKSIADGEQLKYGDPLTSLNEENPEADPSSNVSVDTLEEFGKSLDKLASEAQQMPVGDVRAALGLYRLALIANSSKHYSLAEDYAQKSSAHIKELTDENAGLTDVQIALAYALLKQRKYDAFNAIKNELLKRTNESERMFITMARFCELKRDDVEALKIYNIAVDKRAKQQNTQKPEWQDDYNALLERTKQK
jgi:hypothetical protein